MTTASADVEHMARDFPRPKDSTPARSLTYHCGGHIYRAAIGQPRTQCDDAGRGAGRKTGNRAGRASGNTVLSIVATRRAVEIWSREPARDWPNPSLVAHDAVLTIDYLDNPERIGLVSGSIPSTQPRGLLVEPSPVTDPAHEVLLTGISQVDPASDVADRPIGIVEDHA